VVPPSESLICIPNEQLYWRAETVAKFRELREVFTA
jgi:hypothetical protein